MGKKNIHPNIEAGDNWNYIHPRIIEEPPTIFVPPPTSMEYNISIKF